MSDNCKKIFDLKCEKFLLSVIRHDLYLDLGNGSNKFGNHCPKRLVPNLSIIADRSSLDNFTEAQYDPMMVVILQQLKWTYQFEPSDKAASVESTLQLCSISNTFTLCSTALTTCTQQCFDGKNQPIT